MSLSKGGDGKLKSLTNKIFESPWDVTKEELTSFLEYSPKDIVQSGDYIGLTAAKNLQMAAREALSDMK